MKFVFVNLPLSTATHLKTEIIKHGGDVEYLVNPKVIKIILILVLIWTYCSLHALSNPLPTKDLTVSLQINYVVTTEVEFSSGSSKIQSAVSKNLTIVTPAFIDACLKADQVVEYTPFVCKANPSNDKMIIVSLLFFF